MQTSAHALTQQFLAWIDEAPRSYADAEAWRRSCPHLSIWEDAISDGLVRFENDSSMQQSRLTLTTRGRALLENPAQRNRLLRHRVARRTSTLLVCCCFSVRVRMTCAPGFIAEHSAIARRGGDASASYVDI